VARRFEAPAAGERLCCVVGSPIAHSKSPEIHAAFAAQFALGLRYLRVEVRPGELAEAIAEFRAAGGIGMNVTVPLKEEAWRLAERRTPRASRAGAVNTLWYESDGALGGDNTDGVGLVRDLEDNEGVRLAGRHVLVLGAGGAARGVLPALLDAGPASLTLSNRTAERAAALAAAAGGAVGVLTWGEAPAVRPDLVINATSLSLDGGVPALPAAAIGPATVCYDLVYGPAAAAFLAWAQAAGAARAIDGLGMLVEQAAEAFARWHGPRPATRPVIAALRAALG